MGEGQGKPSHVIVSNAYVACMSAYSVGKFPQLRVALRRRRTLFSPRACLTLRHTDRNCFVVDRRTENNLLNTE